jgi:hypothetical protein
MTSDLQYKFIFPPLHVGNKVHFLLTSPRLSHDVLLQVGCRECVCPFGLSRVASRLCTKSVCPCNIWESVGGELSVCVLQVRDTCHCAFLCLLGNSKSIFICRVFTYTDDFKGAHFFVN